MAPTARTLEFEDLLARSGWARGLARRLVGDEDLAEDVLQEAWVAALERPPQNRPLREWFAVVVRNLALRRRRREAARGEVERRSAREECVPGGQEGVERLQLQRRLADALLALEEPYRSAVIARHIDGLTAAQIGSMQACSPAAARQRVSRGLAALRRELDLRSGGDRSAWCAAFAAAWNLHPVPLAPAAGGATVGWLGGVLMGTKLIVGVVGLGLTLGAWVWFTGRDSADRVDAARGAPAAALAPQRAAEATAALTAVAVAEREVLSSAREQVVPTARTALSGRVVDDRGAPLEGAEVLLLTADPREGEKTLASVLTGVDGAFRLQLGAEFQPDSAEPTCWLLAQREGFLPTRAIPDGPQPTEIALVERPVVSGRLLTADGTPAQPPGRVTLRIEAASGETHYCNAEIDSGGSYAMADMVPGRLVHAGGQARGHGTAELDLALELTPGARENLDVQLTAGALVRGVVVDAQTKQPVPFAEVWADRIMFNAESIEPSTLAGADGHFELQGVTPQRLSAEIMFGDIAYLNITAQAPGFVGKPFQGSACRPLSDGTYFVTVEIQRAEGSITGRVTWPDGKPAAQAILYILDERMNLRFSVTDGDGRFALDGLPEGSISLCVRIQAEIPDQHSGIAQTTVELTGGASVAVDLELSTAQGSISGRVVDAAGAPLAGVRIEAAEHFVSASFTIGLANHPTVTDAAGRYRLSGLLPGRHQVVVSPSERREHAANPERIDVDLGPDEAREGVDFELVPAVQVAGWIDAGGAALEGFVVRLLRTADGEEQARVDADSEGRFRFSGLYPAAYEVVLLQAGREILRVSVGAAGAEDVVLAVPL